MRLVAIVTWSVAAVIGVYLLYLWLNGGGPHRQAAKVTRFPLMLVFSHPVLSVAALGSWVGYLGTGEPVLAWTACAVLGVAALLGFAMFTRWLGGGRHARKAEQRFPLLAVVLHGLAGVTTFVLVLLSVAMTGGR